MLSFLVGHNSAFQAIWKKPPGFAGPGLLVPSILLNGVGNASRFDNSVTGKTCIDVDNCFHDPPSPYSITFNSTRVNGRPKRYLLRLINISFESTFIFAIDNHMLTVISTDFVALKTPYLTRNVTVGIGQRYSVIVEAKPIPDDKGAGADAKSFWIRTYRGNCFPGFPQPHSALYERAGVLFYDGPQATPNTNTWPVNEQDCSDEPYDKLAPMFEWQVDKPNVQDLVGKLAENYTIDLQFKNRPFYFPLASATLGGDKFDPFFIDYSNPIFLNLQYDGEFPPKWVVFREPHVGNKWVS